MVVRSLFSKGSLVAVALSLLVLIISCVKDPAEPEPEFTYAGDYNGFWNTAIGGSRTGIQDQVSATFSEPDENIFVGSFFYSNNLNPCCGSERDGEISFKVEGDSLKNLIFNQDFRTAGFQRLNCSATFAGVGVINEDGNLAFKISGTDCLGTHEGTLLLRKLE